MRALRLAVLMALAAAIATAADVVVLRGGVRIELKQAPVRQGNNVLLTRKDGTLLSVPYSEIDAKATAAARVAAPAPSSVKVSAPETPAEAARTTREGPKARVRLTDADVGHVLDDGSSSGAEKKEEGGASGLGRIDVADYTQTKNGDNLLVRGSLRNLGTTAALNTRLTVAAIDDKGQTINAAEASVSSGTLEPGKSISFTATIPIGAKTVGVVRFTPQWISQTPPAEAGGAAAPPQPGVLPGSGAPGSPAAASSAAPKPSTPQTPYGLGLTYAAPSAPSKMDRPADEKNGYIPGAADPDNQPKTPQ